MPDMLCPCELLACNLLHALPKAECEDYVSAKLCLLELCRVSV